MAANNVSTRKGKSFFAKLMERREAMLALIVVAVYYCFIIYYSKFYDME